MFHKDDKIGPYNLVKPLGRGAAGEVWLAERRGNIATTQVALKLFPVEERPDREPIKQEASLWVTAGCHKNILPIIEAEIYEDQIVLVSEYVPNGSLERWLKTHNGKAPSRKVAIEMIIEILSGLNHLHALRIAHRDLKPENILLKGNTPLITDFGLAKVMRTQTNSFSIAGTELYMSPEAHDGKYSEQSDLWSAGVIFYRMLVGQLPFETILTIFSSDPKTLPDSIPIQIKQVILKSLQKDLTQRYRTADEIIEALKQVIDTQAEIKLPMVETNTPMLEHKQEVSQIVRDDILQITQQLKKYLVQDQFRIELNDFVIDKVQQLSNILTEQHATKFGHSLNYEAQKQYIQHYDNHTKILQTILITGCYWGEVKQDKLWIRCLDRIANEVEVTVNRIIQPDRYSAYDDRPTDWLELLAPYPYIILLYGLAWAFEQKVTVLNINQLYEIGDSGRELVLRCP